MSTRPTTRPDLIALACWVLGGVVAALALVSLGALASGVWLVIAAVGVATVRIRPRSARTWPGVFTGFGSVFLYVALLNRSGPGISCWKTAVASGCDEYLNPLPWVLVGFAFTVPSIALLIRRMRNA